MINLNKKFISQYRITLKHAYKSFEKKYPNKNFLKKTSENFRTYLWIINDKNNNVIEDFYTFGYYDNFEQTIPYTIKNLQKKNLLNDYYELCKFNKYFTDDEENYNVKIKRTKKKNIINKKNYIIKIKETDIFKTD